MCVSGKAGTAEDGVELCSVSRSTSCSWPFVQFSAESGPHLVPHISS